MKEINPMLVSYNEAPKGYPRWLLHKIETYNLQRNDLMTRLNCSTAWIDEIQHHVQHIKVLRPLLSKAILQDIAITDEERERIDEVLSIRSSIYLHRQQVVDWLMENATYTRRTKLVRLEAAFHYDTSLIDFYVELRQRAESDEARMSDKRALTRFLRENCPDALVSPYKRSETPMIDVEPFDWFNRNFIPGNTRDYTNRESLNRAMFKRGAIRITFGKNKTFFSIPPEPDMRCICVRADSQLR